MTNVPKVVVRDTADHTGWQKLPAMQMKLDAVLLTRLAATLLPGSDEDCDHPDPA